MRLCILLPLLLLAACHDQETCDAVLALDGDPTNGLTLFDDECADCHGDNGEGDFGPELKGADDLDLDAVVTRVVDGALFMPSFKGELTDQELADVAAYVVDDLVPAH